LYFSRYKNSNANTDQFFECFEETSGKNLEQFKKCWLYRIGYPKVSFKTFYDSQAMTYKIQFCQKQSNALEVPFHIPIELAAIDNAGNVINGTNLVFEFKSTNSELVFENILTEPAFVSVNRNYSFYGTCLRENEEQDSLILQIRLDDNLFNRIEAFRRLTDIQRIRLLNWIDAKIDDSWIDLFGELLCDRNIAPSTKAFFIRIDEQPLDRNYSSWILELVDVHEKLMRTINKTYKSELVEEFESLDTYKKKSSPKDNIEERILKQTLLELIVIDDTPDSHDLIRSHYARSTSATDKIGALVAMNRSSMIERTRVLEKIYRDWVGHISAYSNYLRIISSGWNNDVFEMIKNERERPSFDITNPTWARALFLTMAGNTKKIWTKEGILWATQVIIDLASLNTYVASKLLNVFQDYKRMRPNVKSMTGDALKAIIEEIPEKINPTINRQALSYFE
ncbi:MAG: DUF3458 domain-containing protein, partial [Desulfomonilaceae bacterium]